MCAPFLRWAGGKSWLVKHLNTIIGNIEIRHYHEPFLGGGAVFFSREHRLRSYLSDINEDLIQTYIAVRNKPDDVIDFFSQFQNTEEQYYYVRDKQYSNPVERAAQFIFLNQMSYNGLYRVNACGQYNVPYGFRDKFIYDVQRIREASAALKNTNIKCGDFAINKYIIKSKDLVFLDPPYTVSHNENGFIKYNQKLFSLDDQQRLSQYIDYIKHKGAYYILTNAAHATIQKIFEKGDRRIELNRFSSIGGKSAKRKSTSEYIFTNIPLPRRENM